MKEKIKGLRLNITISAILTVAVGVLLILYPAESLTAISRIIAVIVILIGAIIAISQIFESGNNAMGIVVGCVQALIGIWIFSAPTAIASIIPIAIGIVLVGHGLQDAKLAIECIVAKAHGSWFAFILGILSIVLGVVCILGAFSIVNLATRIIGIMLIYDGISDMFIVHKVRKATRVVVDSTIISEEDV